MPTRGKPMTGLCGTLLRVTLALSASRSLLVALAPRVLQDFCIWRDFPRCSLSIAMAVPDLPLSVLVPRCSPTCVTGLSSGLTAPSILRV